MWLVARQDSFIPPPQFDLFHVQLDVYYYIS